MLVYLSIFATLGLIGYAANDKQARVALPFLVTFLLWFMGTRFYVGCDFAGYLSRFDKPSYFDYAWEDMFESEVGFNFLLNSIRDADLEFMWLNVACAALFLACAWVFCRAHPKPALILAILFPVVILQLAMSGLRQATALGFLMWATVQFVQGKRLGTAILILLGGTFHTSAIAFLPIAFLAGKSITSSKIIAAVFLVTPVAAWLLGSRLDVYIDRYAAAGEEEMSSGGALIRYVLVVTPALWFWRNRNSVLRTFPKVYPLLQLFALITFALLPVGLINTVALHRLNYYVMPVTILMFVYTALATSERRDSPKVLLPAAIYGAYSLSWFLTSRHASVCYVPYQSYTFQ